MTTNSLGIAINTLLTQAVMELKSGNIRRCEAMGLTLDEIQTLNQITVDDLHYLINSSICIMTLRINHANLSIMLEQSRREQMRMQRIDRALALGGSIELMQYFFGLTTLEVTTRRRLSGIVTSQGRNQTPTEAEDTAVWNTWQEAEVENLESLDALEVMMLIAEQQNIALTSVWILVKKWSGNNGGVLVNGVSRR